MVRMSYPDASRCVANEWQRVAARRLRDPGRPHRLAFAAGAMIFVVVEEVIPESQSGGHGDWATIGAIVGFSVMMTLDVALG
jgi:zinc transporter, ZIP family